MIVKRKIDLNQYLPQVIGDAKEIKAMQEAENPEFALLWAEFVRFEKDVFVLTAEEYGIRRWVDLMELDVSQMSLEEQRALVILKLNENIPYTDRTLRKMLDIAIGQENYSMQILYHEYTIRIEIFNQSIALYLSIQKLLERIKPANLDDVLQLRLKRSLDLYIGIHERSLKKIVSPPARIEQLKPTSKKYIALHIRQLRNIASRPAIIEPSESIGTKVIGVHTRLIKVIKEG